MNKVKILILIFTCLVLGKKVHASHIIGGDLFYTHISGNSYKVTLALVGDCGGSAFYSLQNATPQIDILKNNLTYSSVYLAQDSVKDITPVCKEQDSSTTCFSPTSLIPGVVKYTYSATIILDSSITNWTFQFNGVVTSSTSAGRSGSISNIQTPGTGLMKLEARLYRTAANFSNTSPTYTTEPTPFFCVNQQANYTPGAIDANGDSLVFSLVPAMLTAATNPTVTYAAGYSATNPISSAASTFSFSSINGQLSFTPNLIQTSLVVFRVDEYKNGVLAGSSMREMNFIVLGNCSNNAPSPTITTASAGVTTLSNSSVVICREQGSFSFTFNIQDTNNVSITHRGLPTGAVLNITNNNTDSPTVTFYWNTQNATIGTHSIYFTFTDDACPLSNKQTIAYTVIIPDTAAPSVTNSSYCLNETASALTATATGQLTWYTNAVGGTPLPSAPVPNTSVAGVQTWYVSQRLYNCESRRVPIIVTVFPRPAAPGYAPDSFNFCQHYPDTLPNQGNYLWYYSDTSTTPYASIANLTDNIGLDTFFVSQIVNGCESGRARVVVNISPSSALPIGDTLYTYCQYEQPQPLIVTGQNLVWYNVASGGSGSGTAPVVSTLNAGTFRYYVSQNTGVGCESLRLPITIVVKPKPAPPTVVNPVRYCQYATAIPLTATGVNLKWYSSSAGGVGSDITPVPNTNYVDTLSWWVTQTVDGCESDRTLLNVAVNTKPNGIVLSKKDFVCQYDTDTLYYYGNAAPDNAINWKAPSLKATIIDSIGRDTIVVRFDSAGAIPIRMQVNNRGCLSDEFLFYVDVRPVPIVKIVSDPDICIGEVTDIALNASYVPDIDRYEWDFGGGTTAYGSTDGPFGVSWGTAGEKIITVTVTRQECYRSYTDTLSVHDLPSVSIAADFDDQFCIGDTARLGVVVSQGDTIENYQYRWSPASYFNYGYGFDSMASQTLAIVRDTKPVVLTITDRYDCVSQQELLIAAQPCCDIYLPNAFTPNSDGKNDVFAIKTIGHHQLSSFRIVNRWGNVVFETADETIGWDGTRDGKPQDVGTYFYFIRYRCTDGNYLEKKGELTLIR